MCESTIGYLLDSFKNKKTVFLFKREEVGLPFRTLISTSYYFKDLTKFLPKKIENVWHIINRRDRIDQIYNYYKKLTNKYKLKTFYSKRKFREIFIKNKILDLFIIENESRYKTIIIGKKIHTRLIRKLKTVLK